MLDRTKMQKQRKRKINGELTEFFDFNLDIKARRLYLGSTTFNSEGNGMGVDEAMAEYAIKGLEMLGTASKTLPIRLLLNTNGGDVLQGFAIYDAIRACPAPVHIEVFGAAMSMGAYILQAGDQRLMHPNATIMIHDGSPPNEGNTLRASENWGDFWRANRKEWYGLLAERTNKGRQYWERSHNHDTIYTAKEALKVGLIDEILWPSKQLPKRKA